MTTLLAVLRQAPQQTLLWAVRGYRYLLKPWLGNVCRFEPSCSAYALQALEQHGAAAGGMLTAARILRCHPWCEGGLDPVPASSRLPGSALFTRLLQAGRGQRPSATPESHVPFRKIP